eukprot:7988221-Heterocapsa_arctica.AAC.1
MPGRWTRDQDRDLPTFSEHVFEAQIWSLKRSNCPKLSALHEEFNCDREDVQDSNMNSSNMF